ncbi:hypothetical protein PAXRUDRAFT_17727 [Paxillus rubicundulus Ve08.2h10]|uniref:Uncharacterized protein n=1 Tax=Paxillus rubicundulus Ve08.2h10 TaxID=930991 RepID=A0A0D0D9G8_9AGAM|nr:hypothetical protein PAXRUDRAFT_17727 [Paxillus rubicundulus Ve08.2h10]
MSESTSELMLELLEHSPDLYLDEIQEQLQLFHDLNVSIATIWWTLKQLGLTNKQLSWTAAECSEDLRLNFTMAIGDEPPDRVVCINESAVNVLTTYRMNGWSYEGLRA